MFGFGAVGEYPLGGYFFYSVSFAADAEVVCVPWENRNVTVKAEINYVTIAPEDNQVVLPPEDRTITTPARNRSC